MKATKRIVIGIIALAIAIFLGIQVFNLFYFRLYPGYKQYLKASETIEEGTALRPQIDAGAEVPGMAIAAENEYLKLFVAPKTAAIAVLDKRNGQITYSNPVDGATDPLASKTNRAYLQSQINVDYYNLSRTLGTYSSFEFAAQTGGIAYEKIEDGLRVIYTIGNFESPTGIVPTHISAERLESVLNSMTEEGVKYVKPKFTKNGDLMVLTEGSKGQATLRKLNGFFKEAGYTDEDFAADMLEAGQEDAIPVNFVIPLDYRLLGDTLTATINGGRIQENGGGKLYRIQLLRFFGAADSSESGYILVPNGSGSLIYFNNGKSRVESYSQYIYGIDPLAADYTVVENTQKVRLPIFGLKREKSAILAEIQSGDALAVLSAQVAGSVNSYNAVYPTFTLRGSEKLSMFGTTGNEADIPIIEKELYRENFSVSYRFLPEAQADYSGMAAAYRESLLERGILSEEAAKALKGADIPLYLDIVNAVGGKNDFLGVPYFAPIVMTTFEQAKEMALTLEKSGIKNQALQLQGWFNGGYYHQAPTDVKLTRGLGGAKQLKALTEQVEAFGGRVYGELAIQQISSAAKNYQWMQEDSRYYGAGYTAGFGVVNPTTLTQTSALNYGELIYDVLSPKFVDRHVKIFLRKAEGLALTGYALRDLGDALASDKRRTEVINREQAKQVVAAQIESMGGNDKPLLVSGANLYAIKSSTDIVNLPLGHNQFFIVDEEIPFLQMVLHGYKDYAGGIANLDSSLTADELVLRLVEYGASPRYAFTHESPAKMKYTGLNRYHSTAFDIWKDEAVQVYERVNAALKGTAGYPMLAHETLSPGVKRIVYENGVEIFINTMDKAFAANGVQIPPKDYVVRGGGASGE